MKSSGKSSVFRFKSLGEDETLIVENPFNDAHPDSLEKSKSIVSDFLGAEAAPSAEDPSVEIGRGTMSVSESDSEHFGPRPDLQPGTFGDDLLAENEDNEENADGFLDGMETRASSTVAIKWDDIGGLEEQIQATRRHVYVGLACTDALSLRGLLPPLGLLLYGRGSTGKTMILRALQEEFATKSITVKRRRGTKGRQPSVKATVHFISCRVFQAKTSAFNAILARAVTTQPSLLILDDLDLLNEASQSLLAAFFDSLVYENGLDIQQADEEEAPVLGARRKRKRIRRRKFVRRVVIVATSRDPRCITKSLFSSGRISSFAHVSMPDRQERINVLMKLARNLPISNNLVEMIADSTIGFSGGALSKIVAEYVFNKVWERNVDPMDGVTLDDLDSVGVGEEILDSIHSQSIRSSSSSLVSALQASEINEFGFQELVAEIHEFIRDSHTKASNLIIVVSIDEKEDDEKDDWDHVGIRLLNHIALLLEGDGIFFLEGEAISSPVFKGLPFDVVDHSIGKSVQIVPRMDILWDSFSEKERANILRSLHSPCQVGPIGFFLGTASSEGSKVLEKDLNARIFKMKRGQQKNQTYE